MLDNLLDMGFIETMGRPRKKSERKNSTEHPRSVPSKLKTTLSEAYFEAPKQGVLRVVLNFEDFVKGSPMEIFILDSSFERLSMSIERILKRLFNLECIWRYIFENRCEGENHWYIFGDRAYKILFSEGFVAYRWTRDLYGGAGKDPKWFEKLMLAHDLSKVLGHRFRPVFPL